MSWNSKKLILPRWRLVADKQKNQMSFFDEDFEENDLSKVDLKPMTKDDFIAKTRELLKSILEKYSECHVPDGEGSCYQCNGNAYIERGGEIIDCSTCKGTGEGGDVVFNYEKFLYFVEHEIMFGSSPFLDLINVDVIE